LTRAKFKAVNNRDKNFTEHKIKARITQIEESISRYLTELDRADREPALVSEADRLTLLDGPPFHGELVISMPSTTDVGQAWRDLVSERANSQIRAR
jgi:hypothetical protein